MVPRALARLGVSAALACGLLAAAGVASAGAAQNGRIAFSTGFVLPFEQPGQGAQIFTVRPGGGGLRQLTHVPAHADAAAPAWSPNGRRILFHRSAGGDFDIWVMRADGSGEHRVLADPGFDDELPSFSPDGRTIVFTRCNNLFFFCDIMVMRADGTGMRRIVGGHWLNVAPRFSPDGRRIAFDSTRGGLQSAIWVANVDGSGLRRLTTPKLEGFWPNWSPDGRLITFSSNCCIASNTQVFVMRPDGTHLRQVTHVPITHNAGFPSFSPDGRKLVFQSDIGVPQANHSDLFTINLDGSGMRLVKHLPADIALSDWGTQR